MNLAPVATPKVVKKMFQNFIWNINSEEKTLYLTFDDGPTPEITNWVLSCLKKHKAKATFFCIGKNVEQHPEIFANILNDEHAIGNHTYNHLKGWNTKTSEYINDIKETTRVFDAKNQKSEIRNWNLFRPPYGRIKSKQAKLLIGEGFKIIMWSVLSVDWNKNVTKQKCYDNVVKNAVSGDIIVFHDSIKASRNLQYALPKVLEHYSNLGYKFKSIPE